MRYRILQSGSKLQVVDKIIVIKEGIQSSIQVFQVFFQYFITGRLDDSYYNLIWIFPKNKDYLTFAVLSTDGKTPVIKKRQNKSTNCLEISFFRNNNLIIGRNSYYWKVSLREKCPYSDLFWSVFSRIGTEYGGYSVSLCIQSESWKIRTRITSNTDTF